MKKLLLLFFLFLGFNQVDGALIDTMNSESGVGVVSYSGYENGQIHYININDKGSGVFAIEIKDIYGNIKQSAGDWTVFSGGSITLFDSLINLNNGIYILFITGLDSMGKVTHFVMAYNLVDDTYNVSAGSFNEDATYQRIAIQKYDDIDYLTINTSNTEHFAINLITGQNVSDSISQLNNPSSYFDYITFIEYNDKNFKDGVLLIKNELNSVSAYAFLTDDQFIDNLGNISSDLFVDSRLFLYYVEFEAENIVKYVFSLIGDKSYYIEIDTINMLIYVTAEKDNEVFVGVNAAGDKIFYSGTDFNFKSNQDFLFLGFYGSPGSEDIAYYDDTDETWYIDDNAEILIKYSSTDFDNIFPGYPDADLTCGLLEIGCYARQFGNWLLSFLDPVFGLIAKIKEFIMKFGDLFTTEVRDFSFFVPSASAGFADNLNGLNIEEMPPMVQGFNIFGKALGILMVLIAGIVAIIAINHKKNNS